MRWAVSTAGFAGRQLDAVLGRIAAHGFRHAEFFCMRQTTPGNCWRDTERVRQAFRHSGLQVSSVHVPGDGWDLANEDEARASAALGVAMEALAFASGVDAPMVVAHPVDVSDAVTADNREDYGTRARKSLEALAERAAVHGVGLAVENMPPRAVRMPGGCVRDLLGLTARLGPHVGLCLDTGRCVANGVDPSEELALGGTRVLNVHLHDARGPRERHLLPGSGIIDWDAFFLSARAAAPECTCTFEVDVPEGREEEYLREMARFRDRRAAMGGE